MSDNRKQVAFTKGNDKQNKPVQSRDRKQARENKRSY